MRYSVFFAAASAAVASAQVVQNPRTGIWECASYAPNANYCAGDSLSGPIIIRCKNGVGQPGSCSQNLSGASPVGPNFAQCYQTGPLAGDALCSKNCIAYPEDGSRTFPVPGCKPAQYTTSTSAAYTPPVYSSTTPAYTPPVYSSTTPVSSSTTPVSSSTTPAYTPPVYSTTTPAYTPPVYSTTAPAYNTTKIPSTSTEYTTLTVTTTCTTEGTTATSTYTTVVCPKCTGYSSYSAPSGTGIPAPPTNGTFTTHSPTRTPTGPTGTAPPQYTGAASMHTAGGFLAGVGFLAAYFL